MYIDGTGYTYYRGSQQRHSRAPFLILCTLQSDVIAHPKSFEIRGIVRSVALQQCGHWMTGKARVAGQSLTLSGPYGADGLTIDVSPEVFAKATPLPDALRAAWAGGGGWNSAGSEATEMAQWARSLPRGRH